MIKRFKVVPSLPEKLKPLMDIAKNLWWVWNFDAIELFRRLDVELWRELSHNPIDLLGNITQKCLDEAARSESFLAHLDRIVKNLDWHITKKSWFDEQYPNYNDTQVAYFSAEFGIHECLPIYSGGLGILAGDHLKSSSELGIPLTGVGLLYRLGYFHQYLNIDGWQQERFPETDFYNIPITLVKNDKNQPIIVDIDFPEHTVYAQIWQTTIGRLNLYLLDTNIEPNSADDKSITDQLYGGDLDMRIKQEMVLGIGGVRALERIGKKISCFHMNEGHSAFLAIERIRREIEKHHLTFNEALEYVMSTSVFTTHTPVPAGNDRFPAELINKYLIHYYDRLTLTEQEFLALGRENPQDKREAFCMTVLALKSAAFCNGVSRLHGSVSRNMWKNIWPSVPTHEIPIEHITNGIQTLSWTSDEMMRLFNRYLGPGWIDNPVDKEIWEHLDTIPNSELWRCRERLRERLVGFARRTLKRQLIERGVPKAESDRAEWVLDPEILTIGFARRFATYKRATLILKKMDLLERLLLDKDRPIQLLFAGKAHPRDNMGKELIKHVIQLCRDPRFRGKIVFLEDYDINTARYMVQGVDVWLNTPIRPKEASGTSGMKVIPNGGLNISVLDGWWVEGYDTTNGWAIGRGEQYDDLEYQDEVESLSLYNILEKEVIPLYYNRGYDNIPNEWVNTIKNSMKTLCPQFNTNRMVREYTEKYYLNAHDNFKKFQTDNFSSIKELAAWKKNLYAKWNQISILNLIFDDEKEIAVGSKLGVRVLVDLKDIPPDDIQVELYFGSLNPRGEIDEGASLPMFIINNKHDGTYEFQGQMLCLKSGQFGFTVRVVPKHANLTRRFETGIIKWA